MTTLALKYTVSLEDLVAFNEDYFLTSESFQRRFRKERLMLPGVFVIGGITFALLTFVESSNSTSRYLIGIFTFLLCLAPGILIFALTPRSSLKGTRMRARNAYSEGKNVTLLGEQELVLDSMALVVRNRFFESRYNWEALEKVTSTDSYIFIYISATSAIVIPKQAIIEGNWQEVTNLIEEKLKVASI